MIHVGIAIAILMGSLLLGVSIPFAFGAGTIYMYTMLGGTFATTLPVGFNGINTMVLLAIPTFIMAGGFIEKGKVGDELVSVVEMLVGRFRGGLMLAVSYASAIFGAICGSAAATCSCIGSIMAPKLKMAGYSKGLSAALISSSAPLGLLIPPSSLMIMYAWVSGESVLACFLSTVIPGVCLATLLGVVGMILAQREGVQPLENWVPIYSAPGLKKTWHATPALLLPVIILGGIYGGVMTPTEAACVSTLYCIPVAIYIYRGMKWSDAPEILKETGTTTGVIMVMLFFVSMLSRYFIYEDLPGALVDMIYLFTTNKNVILLMMNVFMIIMGMLMDDGSALLLSTPILVPIAKEIGVSPIHFAAILGVNLGMGNVTPPCAPMLYLGARVVGTDASHSMKPTLLLILFAWLPTLLVVTYVPGFSLWLPNIFGFWAEKNYGGISMEKITKIETVEVAISRNGISQAVRFGNVLFVSGQVGEDIQGNIPKGIEAQVELAIENARRILRAAGSDLDKVLMCRCFLQKQEDFAGMNQVYFKYFGDAKVGPARYTVVAPPVADCYLFEIAMFAVVE